MTNDNPTSLSRNDVITFPKIFRLETHSFNSISESLCSILLCPEIKEPTTSIEFELGNLDSRDKQVPRKHRDRPALSYIKAKFADIPRRLMQEGTERFAGYGFSPYDVPKAFSEDR